MIGGRRDDDGTEVTSRSREVTSDANAFINQPAQARSASHVPPYI